MPPIIAYPHIDAESPAAAKIDGTRYKVIHLAAEHYQHGWTAEELLRQHPDLRPEQVYSALAYFYDHYDQLTVLIQEKAKQSEAARNQQAFSRDELLKRKG